MQKNLLLKKTNYLITNLFSFVKWSQSNQGVLFQPAREFVPMIEKVHFEAFITFTNVTNRITESENSKYI